MRKKKWFSPVSLPVLNSTNAAVWAKTMWLSWLLFFSIQISCAISKKTSVASSDTRTLRDSFKCFRFTWQPVTPLRAIRAGACYEAIFKMSFGRVRLRYSARSKNTISKAVSVSVASAIISSNSKYWKIWTIKRIKGSKNSTGLFYLWNLEKKQI